MLSSLSIRNIVLIEAAHLEFAPGLAVLTGETGAGKSIVLGSLELALGGRGDRALIRPGAEQASVAASFDVPPGHPALALAADAGIEARVSEPLILRRTITVAGQSRAFINDAPASVQLLRQVGNSLVEIHGQHDDRGLLDPTGHRDLLDDFADLAALRAKMSDAYEELRAAESSAEALAERQSRLAAESDYLRHAAEELKALAPEPGEETRIAEERALLSSAARIAGDVEEALEALGERLETRLNQALRKLERLDGAARTLLEPATSALERTTIEAREAETQLQSALKALKHEPERLAALEERLYALRAAARKFRVPPDRLGERRAEIDAALAQFEGGRDDAAACARRVDTAREAARAIAQDLSVRRGAAAAELDTAVNRELGPLKLSKAVFSTSVARLAVGELGPTGHDRVVFEVTTNPGAPAGPLKSIASGGELARFILALKVVLARGGSATSLVFDEVDRGIGGAVADAVGERLARLARGAQVLVVTHSPQVAARAEHHFLVAKSAGKSAAHVTITPLEPAARAEEIARMLAGAQVTDEARAAAQKLLESASEAAPPRKRKRAAG